MTKFTVHPLFFFVILMAFLHGFIYDVLLLFSIVLIHEIGHAAVAYFLGWRIKKIELLPFGGVAEVDEHGNKPLAEELLVVLAGPLMNVIMLCISWLLINLNIWNVGFGLQFMEYNLIILIFNLLPIWPLDGGKLVHLAFCLYLPYKRAIKYSLMSSVLFLLLYLCMVALHYSMYFYLWTVAVFLVVSLFLEGRQSPYQYIRFLMARYSTSPNPKELQMTSRLKYNKWKINRNRDIKTIILYPQDTIKEALGQLYRQKSHYFCLVDQQGRLMHMFREEELLHYYFERKWISRAVGDIIR